MEAVYQDDEADTVTAQVAAPNEIVQKGSEVLLYTANTGEIITEAEIEQVTVPNVLGRTRLGVKDMLDEAGLEIRIDPPDQTGIAFRQVPEAGTKVEAGTEVLVEFENAATATLPGDEEED